MQSGINTGGFYSTVSNRDRPSLGISLFSFSKNASFIENADGRWWGGAEKVTRVRRTGKEERKKGARRRKESLPKLLDSRGRGDDAVDVTCTQSAKVNIPGGMFFCILLALC